jgi:hypothetical protein
VFNAAEITYETGGGSLAAILRYPF